MSVINCKHYDDGKCTAVKGCPQCNPLRLNDFNEEFEFKNSMVEACEGLSIFGNYLIALSDEDIEQLKQGKILFISGEYSICVAYKNE